MMEKFKSIHKSLSRIKRTLYQWYYNVRYWRELNKLAVFKDKYKGKRCFVIGTGPSLTAADLDVISGEYTFASNSIFRYFDKTAFRPDFYAVCDRTYYMANQENCDAVKANKQKFFPMDFALKYGFKADCCYFLRRYYGSRHPKFRDNPYRAFEEGSTVTYHLLQLAVMMGFTEIYLLGIDFNYSMYKDNKGNIIRDDKVKDYAFNDKATNYTVPNLEACYYAYCSAEEYCKKHNYKVRIYNATRGGKLEVFQRVNFDDLIISK